MFAGSFDVTVEGVASVFSLAKLSEVYFCFDCYPQRRGIPIQQKSVIVQFVVMSHQFPEKKKSEATDSCAVWCMDELKQQKVIFVSSTAVKNTLQEI